MSTPGLERLARIGADRRVHPRFTLTPGYTPVEVRFLGDTEFSTTGHAYDISEGGVRFELDQPIAPGQGVAMKIMLPSLAGATRGPGRAIFVFANVVWLEDEDEPAPYRMAAVFTGFARAEDQARLRAELSADRAIYRRQAA